MRCLDSLLFASVLLAVPCCGRTGLATVVSGSGGTMAPGGIAATGGASATAGMSGTGGSPSTSIGSTSTGDLDACSSDDDCTTSCIWTTAPTDSSQCFAEYCCGSNWMSKKRCGANQAAWAIYCPNQSSTFIDCPCITMCDTPAQTITLGCVGGKCEFVCSPPVVGTGGSTVFPPGNGGYTGNDGAGGMRGADAGSGGSFVTGSGSGGSSGTGGSSGRVVTCTFGGLLVDGETLSSYTESGITVLATAGGWQARTGFGNPAPSILFFASAGGAATGQVKVTAGGSAFSLVTVDLYSSVTTIPYVFTGLMGSTKVFSVSGTVPNTFGNFATVANPNAGDLIDTLVIELTDGVAQNPMGLDNVRLMM
jgi:hypothetical protein